MKPKRTISGYILLIGIMGLSIVGGILAFQIFSAATKTSISGEQANLIKALDGQINPTIIENLEKRRKFTDAQLSSVNVPTPTTAPSPSPNASPGGNIVIAPNNGASPSAGTE